MKKKRQYRSNQGRSQEKENETYKMLEFSIILFTIISIIYLISQYS